MRFLSIHTCKQLFEIGSLEDAITSTTFCPKGHHIVAVMDSGALKVYDVRSLAPDISKVNSLFNLVFLHNVYVFASQNNYKCVCSFPRLC